MENIYFYSPIDVYGSWDFRSLDKGIGGSETSHIILAAMFARRGYNVTSYAPVLEGCPEQDESGCVWKHSEDVDFNQDGLWIFYRCPQELEKIDVSNKEIWIVCQDVDYPEQFTDEVIDKVDRVLALCREHAQYLMKKYPKLKGKIFLSGNGVRSDLVYKLKNAEDCPERNPKRLIYSSSPDRGLLELLQIFSRAKERDPELELHCYYGMKNLEKVASVSPAMNRQINAIKKAMDQPGVFWHDKVSQTELYNEFLKSGIWCYPTWFSESSCITCMEAQALGAIPITRPYWGLADNVKFGVFIQGNPRDDELVKARYVDNLVTLASGAEFQAKMRIEMMNTIIVTHNWSRICDQWECWIQNFQAVFNDQTLFQAKHLIGKTLNVGSDLDMYNLKQFDVTNLDVYDVHPSMGFKSKKDILADFRQPQPDLENSFDSVILGDIIEHMSLDDSLKLLINARKSLRNGGRVIITCPEDHRTYEQQYRDCPFGYEADEYTDGCSTHHRLVTKQELLDNIDKAGLTPLIIQPLENVWFKGWGIVAEEQK